jgi:hypothetical protein
MVYRIEKFLEMDRLRNFTVTLLSFPEIIIVGGVSVFGEYNSIYKLNMTTGEKTYFPQVENHDRFKRIEHNTIMVNNFLYIIGGADRFKNSLLILDLSTFKVEEKEIDFQCTGTCIDYCAKRKKFIIFTGKYFHTANLNFNILSTTPVMLEHHFHQNRFRSLLYGDWMYVFGGYNGISYSKRFFKYHIDEKLTEFLPSLPNAYNIRITGSEMIHYDNKIFFILNMFSFSKNNFLYVYNIEYERWENNYVINFENKMQMINIYSDERMTVGLKTGMKSFGSFAIDDNLYIFATDSMFFEYPNLIYKIQISKTSSPYPLLGVKHHDNTFDFCFELNDQYFHCHRYVLSSFSSYFKSLFESKFKENHFFTVELDNICNESLKCVIDYMYHYPFYKISIFNPDLFIEILEIANYFQITTILFDLETIMITQPDRYKVTEYKEILKNFNLPRLHKVILNEKKRFMSKSEKLKVL